MLTVSPSEFGNNYPPIAAELIAKFQLADQLQVEINQAKEQNPHLWNTIITRLRTDWTYNSCGIEGSTLSRGETHFFLTEGLTVEGKPFKDFLDARNHAEAVDLLFDVVASQQSITAGLIKEVNALLLKGVSDTPARNQSGGLVYKPATPGEYKKHPNHVLKADGTIHHYVEPIHVSSQMQALLDWVNLSIDTIHPIHIAAVAHYNMVRIHPFDDGNGRGARFLMNLILLHKHHFPAVVQLETKRYYLDALNEADRGNLTPFVDYIADCLILTKRSVIDALKHSTS
jgi:Fic family protein